MGQTIRDDMNARCDLVDEFDLYNAADRMEGLLGNSDQRAEITKSAYHFV